MSPCVLERGPPTLPPESSELWWQKATRFVGGNGGQIGTYLEITNSEACLYNRHLSVPFIKTDKYWQ